MKRPVLVIGGVLLVLVGLVWTMQGLGYLPGSVTLWAVIGPLVVLAGLLLAWRGLGRSRARRGGPPNA